MRVATVIVAGGSARRLGGVEKPLLALGRGTILSSILDRLGPSACPLAVNSNGDPLTYAPLPVLPDPALPPGVEPRPGPLAGLLAACLWAAAQGSERVLTVPGDAPFLPSDLLDRLVEGARAGGGAAVATSGGRVHPVTGLWPASAAEAIRAALADGVRRADALASALGARAVAFEAPAGGPDPFTNVNRPEDLAQARALAGSGERVGAGGR